MADIFGQAYISSGTPVSIVAHYLSAYTREEIPDPPDSCQPLAIKSYDIRKAYVARPFKGSVYYRTTRIIVDPVISKALYIF